MLILLVLLISGIMSNGINRRFFVILFLFIPATIGLQRLKDMEE